MNKLQGVEGVDKSELFEESQKEEYILFIYHLCKNSIYFTYYLFSHGEKYTILLFYRLNSKKTYHFEILYYFIVINNANMNVHI